MCRIISSVYHYSHIPKYLQVTNKILIFYNYYLKKLLGNKQFEFYLFIFFLQYFETDDPELYKTKIRYIEENDVSDMELTFSEEEYSESGQLFRVRHIILIFFFFF